MHTSMLNIPGILNEGNLTLCESQVALVRQWCVYQLRCVALILVRVLKFSIHHAHNTNTILPQVISERKQNELGFVHTK